jgi:hypothetical protein
VAASAEDVEMDGSQQAIFSKIQQKGGVVSRPKAGPVAIRDRDR